MIDDRKLTRDDLPFPLDRPITGQDLLDLFPSLLGPLWSQAALAGRGDVFTVVSVNAGSPKTVTVDDGTGQTSRVRYLAVYSPTVGDAVLIFRNAKKAVVLGRLA